jgi:hypothetical protein
MPQAAETAFFALSEGLAHRETLSGTGAEQLTPAFGVIATPICCRYLCKVIEVEKAAKKAPITILLP